MKSFGALALALAVATASHVADPNWLSTISPSYHQREISVKEFSAGHEYEFVYEAQLATGIPGSSDEHTAHRMQAVCKVAFESNNNALLNIVDVRWGKLDARMEQPRKLAPFESFEHVPADEQLKQTIKLPVMFKYDNGMISELVFDGAERPFMANIKRGILNMLQVNLDRTRRVDRPTEMSGEMDVESIDEHRNNFYTVIEPTIEGECETSYTVIDRPSRYFEGKRALNVTKSIDFEKCNKRPEHKYNYRFADLCPTCEKRYSGEERVLKSNSVSETKLVCGENKRRCLITQCRMESQYNFVPFGEQGNIVATYVNQLLLLVKSGPVVSSSLRTPSNPIRSDSDLIYTKDFAAERERFMMTGEHEDERSLREAMPSGEKVLPMVKSLLKKLVHYTRESVQEEAPRHFAKLVKLLSWLQRDDIKLVHSTFYQSQPADFTPEESEAIRSLLPDAVALCGTEPCVKHVTGLIKNKEITGFKANSIIRKMMDTKVVSEKIIEHIWDVSKSTERADLKQAVYLTVGSLLNGLCAPNKDKLALEATTDVKTLCPRSLKQQWTEKLISKFDESESTMNKIVCLKAIANAGLDTSAVQLEKIIRNTDKVYPTVIRTEAILALRQLREIMPHKIVRMLMPVALNKKEPSAVRIAAFYKIMKCNPEKPVLDKLAHMLNKEPNKQVASFVYTTMNNMANSTIPCEKRMAKDLQQSLRLSKYLPVRSWLGYSKLMRAQWYSPRTNLGTNMEFTSLMSEHGLFPKAIALSLHKIMGGEWKNYMASIGLMQSNLEPTLHSYLRNYRHNVPSSLSDILSGKSISAETDYKDDVKNVFESLRLSSMERSSEELFTSGETSDDVESEPFSYMYLRYLDQDYAVLPLIDSQLLRRLPQTIRQAIREGRTGPLSELIAKAKPYLSDRSMPINFHSATFLQRSERTIPTSMGLPLTISYKTPAVFKASGLAKIDFDETEPLRKIKVELKNFKPSMVVTNVMKVQVWSPTSMHALKVLSKAKVYLPFTGHLSIDMLKPEPEVSFVWQPEQHINTEVDVLRLSTRPVLVSMDYTLPVYGGQNDFWRKWMQPEETTIHGNNWDRVNTFDKSIGGKWLGVEFNARGRWHRTPQQPVAGTPMCPLSGPNKLTLSIKPGYEMPNEIRFALSGKLFESVQGGKLMPTGFKSLYSGEKSSSSEEFLRESSEEIRGKPISEEYINKFESGIPTRHMLRLSVDTRGSPVKRSASTTADCRCSEQMRHCQCQLKVERTPIPTVEQADWKLEMNVDTLYPKIPFTLAELDEMNDDKFHCDIKTNWGPRSSMDKKMNIKIVGDRSSVQKRRAQRSIYRRLAEQHKDTHKSLFSPVAQYQKLVDYAALDEYKIKINYKVSPYVRNMTNMLYRMIKSHPSIFPETEVDQINVNNPEQQIKIKLNVDPINFRYLNVTVKSPIETMRAYDLPLPTRMPVLNLRRRSQPSTSWSDLFNNLIYSPYRSVCEVRSDRVRTFELAEFNAPITTCYSLLAKDCGSSENTQFAVMIKKVDGGSEKKQIKIVTQGRKLVIKPVGSSHFECTLNGETKRCSELPSSIQSHGHTVLRVRKSGPYVHVSLPETGVNVYFDGYAANVKVSPLYRSVVCGLCASNINDFALSDVEQTPAHELRLVRSDPESVKNFFLRYLLRNEEGCNVENEIVDSIRSYERRPVSWTRPTSESLLAGFDSELSEMDEPECVGFESCPQRHSTGYYYNRERDLCDAEPEMCDRQLNELGIESPLRSTKRSHSVRPIVSTKVLERGHDVCFSKRPVPRCPAGTVPKSYETERIKTAFTCIRRTDRLADVYQSEARRHLTVSGVNDLEPTFAEEIVVPKQCRYL